MWDNWRMSRVHSHCDHHGGHNNLKHLIICGFDSIHRRLDSLENFMSVIRDEFDQTLTDLSAAISANTAAVTDLAGRIDALPADVADITQADVDALKAATDAVKASADQVNTLAVAAPTVPNPEPAPTEGETPAEPAV